MKTCKCGKQFTPLIERQQFCLNCIMCEEPRVPKKAKFESVEFRHWFIYHWQNIRKAAAQKYGVDFEEGKT